MDIIIGVLDGLSKGRTCLEGNLLKPTSFLDQNFDKRYGLLYSKYCQNEENMPPTPPYQYWFEKKKKKKI
jgi:hypothetical protein